MTSLRRSATWTVAVAVLAVAGFLSLILRTGPNGQGVPSAKSSLERGPENVTRPDVPAEAKLWSDVLSVSDAAGDDNGWYVLDQLARRVHRFDSTGALLASFGRQGDGPGEFTFPDAMALHEDTVVVVDTGEYHLYRSDGEHLSDRPILIPECGDPRVRDVASIASRILLLVRCLHAQRGMETLVYTEDQDGSFRTLVRQSSGPPGQAVFDFNSIPVLSPHPLGFLFGDVTNDCLNLFDPDGVQLTEICQDWIESVPVPASVADAFANDANDVRRYAQQMRVAARVIDLKEHLWPYHRIFVSDEDHLVFLAPVPTYVNTDGEIAGYRLIAESDSGGQVELSVPHASVLFLSRRSVLAGWDDISGTRIAIYTLGRSELQGVRAGS